MAYKLLLADDSQTIQKVVEIVLSPEGFDILAYSDGEEALTALATVMPDLVLADIEMPKLNGYKLCEKIKGNAATLHLPVILLAGAFEPFDEDYAKSVGADDFILKPFESHELISKVKSLLMQHETLELPVHAAVEEVVSVASLLETQWAESIALDWQAEADLPAQEKVAVSHEAHTKAFDEELLESMQALHEESKEEYSKPEEVSPDEISIEEISKMVKEAMGEPLSSVAEKTAERQMEVAPADISEISTEAVDDLLLDSLQYQAGGLKSVVDLAIKDRIGELLPSILKNSIERAVADTVPNLLEEAIRESLSEITGSLQRVINDEIRKVVPGLAETIIKREIEKITAELI